MGVTGFGLVLLKVVPAVQAVNAAFGSTGHALAAAFAANPVLGVIVSMGALLATTERGRESLGDLFAAVAPAVEGLASILGDAASGIAIVVDGFASIGGAASVAAVAIGLVGYSIWNAAAATGGVAAAAGGATMNMAALGVTTTTVTASGTAGMLGMAGATGIAAGAARMLKGVLDSMKSHPVIAVLSLVIGAGYLLNSLFGKKEDDEKKNRGEVTPKGEGFESLTATWERLQSAAASIPAQQLAVAQSQLQGPANHRRIAHDQRRRSDHRRDRTRPNRH